MEGVNGGAVEEERKPLSEVVGDCVQRWFQDALKEARRGDSAMQGRAWAEKASRYRPSVWKVGTKRPGYNASDSDSDEMNDDEKQ
ncbi:hypothetical protein OsJ_18129 [Oryza sativa Japonica Group]|uniref:Uncharacterized protein n=1 Tax=Oryza sativa subsp. japonica TaxID=39947 RepID=B9FGZ6_ORYSJ|nr:hypothetical protein OsJ_18129 [Oryza sativa Japonica Group]